MRKFDQMLWASRPWGWFAASGLAVVLVACNVANGQKVDNADDWTLLYDFNDGKLGEKVANLDAGGRTIYTHEQMFEGSQAASLKALRGKENFGGWGGRMTFPRTLKKDDEIWWRVRTYWPKGMDYSAAPRLKFLRIHTKGPDGANHGYNDIYINPPGSEQPFMFIYEGEAKWTRIGDKTDAIKHDTWETYELYIKLDDQTKDDGGAAVIRFWKDGKLLGEITDRKTLKTAEDTAGAALLFTYWNSSPYMGQVLHDSDKSFVQGETVTADSAPDTRFDARGVGEAVVYLQDPAKDWRKRVKPWSLLKPGDKLTGKDSGITAKVTQVLHSHPVMDIEMYVDDMVITSATPEGRDADGNPRIETNP